MFVVMRRRDAGRFVVLLDVLWSSRNNVVWKDTREDACILVYKPIIIGMIGF